MTRKRNPLNSTGEIGVPFYPPGSEKYPLTPNARIIPSQFNFPYTPMNFMVIRDVSENDDEPFRD